MKNRFVFTLVAMLICSTLAMAQLQKLPAPAKTGGKSVMEIPLEQSFWHGVQQ